MRDLVPTSSRPRPAAGFIPPERPRPSTSSPAPLRGRARDGVAGTNDLVPDLVPGLTVEEFAERLPPSPLTAEAILHDLEAQRLAERDHAGRWALTPSGWRVGRALLEAAPAEAA